MANKVGLGYRIFITTNSGDIISIDSTISPFTVEFDIQRDAFASTNICDLRIMNLNQQTRGFIYKGYEDYDYSRDFIMYAGYGSNSQSFPLVFSGKIGLAWNYRDGDTFVTEVKSLDGGNAALNALYNDQLSAGTPYSVLATKLIAAMKQYGISQGKIASVTGTLQKDISVSGQAWQMIAEQFPGFFVDCGTANILGTNDFLSDAPITIDSSIGLLGTPLRQGPYHTSCEIIFEPTFKIGQKCILNSFGAPEINTTYKCISLKHRGVISPVKTSETITTVGLFGNPSGIGLI